MRSDVEVSAPKQIDQRLADPSLKLGVRPLRIAYISPLPPIRSGIADYSWDLLPFLAENASITLFAEQPNDVAPLVKKSFPLLPISVYSKHRSSFDLTLYHMGNSLHHRSIYQTALRYPGVVVLHDYGLHHFIAASTGSDAEYSKYVRELAYVQGSEGANRAWRIRYNQEPYPLFELPLNDRLIDRSLGIIVHSQANKEKLRANHPTRPVALVPMQIPIIEARSRRDELDLPAGALIFATTGYITAERRMELALRAFSGLLQSYPNSVYLIVGQVHDEIGLTSIIADLGLQDKVHVKGFAPDKQSFVDWMATADVIVNLRYPTVGETSASALRAMAAGRPVIVFDHGTYSELPDETCLKIPPMDDAALLAGMLYLASSQERRERLGQLAITQIREQHDPIGIAKQTISFFHELFASIDRRYGGVS